MQTAERQCTKCRESKPCTAFHRNGRSPGGYARWCKRCVHYYNSTRPAEVYVRSVMRFVTPKDY